MPPRNLHQARRRREARLMKSGVTSDPKKFTWLCRKTQNRIGIVTEGDSWFSYPPSFLFTGPNSNVIDWVVSAVKGSGTDSPGNKLPNYPLRFRSYLVVID